MDVERFWELNAGLSPENASEQLQDRLTPLDASEIASYQEHFDRVFGSAYRWDLWAAAYIIDGGCSDDGFMDFRYGLISRGRSVFEAALADPDSLADVATEDEAGYIPDEEFGYVAQEAYALKTKQPMPHGDSGHADEPGGEEWDFDDEELGQQKLPKLWAKFGA